jgi:GNAT superfamily N-acetyltransferase
VSAEPAAADRLIVDRAIVDRLESTAATGAVALARALAASVPGSGAAAEAVGTGALVALGAGRYVNRAVGVSLATVAPDELVGRVQAFFGDRGLPAAIEVCSWAPSGLLDELGRRGFRPAWFRNVYVRRGGRVPAAARPGPVVVVREVDDALIASWQRVLADGNSIDDPAARATSDEFAAAAHTTAGRTDYLAEIDGEPAGCGSLERIDGVGWVGAAATAPELGGRGVQGALLRHRIDVAAADGCDLVAASALPGGRSARNLERHGFALAYAQLVMTLATSTRPG